MIEIIISENDDNDGRPLSMGGFWGLVLEVHMGRQRGEVSGGSATPPRPSSTVSPRPQQTATTRLVWEV